MGYVPLWALVGGYLLVALAAAGLVRRSMRLWIERLRPRLHPNFYEVLAGALPRPAGTAFFLFAVTFGLRVFELPASVEAVTKRVLPFLSGMLAVTLVMRMALRSIDAYGQTSPQLKSTAGIGKAITWIAGLALIAVIGSDAAGISLAPALTALGVGSLAVALALQDTLANFFSGIYLLLDKPIRPGDFVRLGDGEEGYVETIGWRSTHLRTLAPSYVIVPNATLSKAVITNFGAANPRLALTATFDVSPDSEVDAVEAMIREEAAKLAGEPGIDARTSPVVRLSPSGERGMTFTVAFTMLAGGDAGLAQETLRRRVLTRFRKENVKLANPSSFFPRA